MFNQLETNWGKLETSSSCTTVYAKNARAFCVARYSTRTLNAL